MRFFPFSISIYTIARALLTLSLMRQGVPQAEAMAIVASIDIATVKES